MPGIFGIISNRPKEINVEELNAMSNLLHMEPFYRKGDGVFAEAGVYAGWTCHEGSFSDCMPVFNEKKDITLLYSGENFKDIEEIDELKGRNHSFNKRSASYLVHMYEEWGEDFLTMLNGRFHGLLIDQRTGETILFSDRYGLHRLYYYEGKDAFYFSTEAKAILGILPPESRGIDISGLSEFFTYNCVLDHRTLFKNVFALPGGSSWFFSRSGEINKKDYFRPSELETQTLLEKEFHYERLVYTLQKLLKRYFKAEDQIGVFLSKDPGVRIILANALYGPEKVPGYTFSGPDRNREDLQIAQRIVEATGQALHLIDLDRKFLKEYPRLAQKAVSVSDGAMDITGACELYLDERVREIAPVQVSGIYGGAVLKKERLVHQSNLDRKLFDHEFQNMMSEVGTQYTELSSDGLTFNLSRGIPWTVFGNLSVDQSQMMIRTPLLDNDLVDLMCRALDDVMEGDQTLLRLVRDGNPVLAEKTASAPKGVLSSLMGLFQRRNRRTRSPYPGAWYANELSGYVQEILLDKRSLERPYINKPWVENMIKDHMQCRGDYGKEITAALTAELVHRFFMDRPHA
mgnify:CR=1 FL=1